MNELANSGLGNVNKELAIGASDEVVQELFDYFVQKGMTVVLLDEDDRLLKTNADIILHRIDWDVMSAYLSPFKPEGYSPELLISLNNSSKEYIIDQFTGFLEGIQF